MVAAIYGRADPWTATQRAAVASARASRTPAPGRPNGRVFRRRRAVTLLVVAVAAVTALTVTASLRRSLAGSGGGALTTTGSVGVAVMQPAAAHVHIVQPGETLWSIVMADGTHGDPRPIVDRLARQLGERPLQVGQRLMLP